MKFFIRFVVTPSSYFGLPDGSKLVAPSSITNFVGPTIDNHDPNMPIVGYGTLSVFRSKEDSVNLTIELDGATSSWNDNLVRVAVEAEDPSTAYTKALHAIEKQLDNLCLDLGVLFNFRAYQIESEAGEFFPVPKVAGFTEVTIYDVAQLKHQLAESGIYSKLTDQKLYKALEYYEQALLLHQNIDFFENFFSKRYQQTYSSIFMNLWKALSTIVGDPSKDPDYQSRYKELGYDFQFFEEKIQKIKAIRDSYDVAHYSLDSKGVETVKIEFGFCQQIASEVIKRYRKSLTTIK